MQSRALELFSSAERKMVLDRCNLCNLGPLVSNEIMFLEITSWSQRDEAIIMQGFEQEMTNGVCEVARGSIEEDVVVLTVLA